MPRQAARGEVARIRVAERLQPARLQIAPRAYQAAVRTAAHRFRTPPDSPGAGLLRTGAPLRREPVMTTGSTGMAKSSACPLGNRRYTNPRRHLRQAPDSAQSAGTLNRKTVSICRALVANTPLSPFSAQITDIFLVRPSLEMSKPRSTLPSTPCALAGRGYQSRSFGKSWAGNFGSSHASSPMAIADENRPAPKQHSAASPRNSATQFLKQNSPQFAHDGKPRRRARRQDSARATVSGTSRNV